MPEGPALMDQYGRQFVPDLLFVRVGQVVEFRNSEDVDHNIRVLRNPTGTTVMDVSGSQNQVFKHTFDRPGSYDVSCDVHPGMRATIVASRTPYAIGTDDRGTFTLKDVPPGGYHHPRDRVGTGDDAGGDREGSADRSVVVWALTASICVGAARVPCGGGVSPARKARSSSSARHSAGVRGFNSAIDARSSSVNDGKRRMKCTRCQESASPSGVPVPQAGMPVSFTPCSMM